MGKRGSLLFSSMGGSRDVPNDSPYAGRFGNQKGASDQGEPYVSQSFDVPNDSPYAGRFGNTDRGSGSAMGGSFNVPNTRKYAEGGEVEEGEGGDDYECSEPEKMAAHEFMGAMKSGDVEGVARALKAFLMLADHD